MYNHRDSGVTCSSWSFSLACLLLCLKNRRIHCFDITHDRLCGDLDGIQSVSVYIQTPSKSAARVAYMELNLTSFQKPQNPFKLPLLLTVADPEF